MLWIFLSKSVAWILPRMKYFVWSESSKLMLYMLKNRCLKNEKFLDTWFIRRFLSCLILVFQMPDAGKILKGGPQNRGIFDREFKILRIGRFWRFQRYWTQKICGILWVINKKLQNDHSTCQLTYNSNAVWKFPQKFQKYLTCYNWVIWAI